MCQIKTWCRLKVKHVTHAKDVKVASQWSPKGCCIGVVDVLSRIRNVTGDVVDLKLGIGGPVPVQSSGDGVTLATVGRGGSKRRWVNTACSDAVACCQTGW